MDTIDQLVEGQLNEQEASPELEQAVKAAMSRIFDYNGDVRLTIDPRSSSGDLFINVDRPFIVEMDDMAKASKVKGFKSLVVDKDETAIIADSEELLKEFG